MKNATAILVIVILALVGWGLLAGRGWLGSFGAIDGLEAEIAASVSEAEELRGRLERAEYQLADSAAALQAVVERAREVEHVAVEIDRILAGLTTGSDGIGILISELIAEVGAIAAGLPGTPGGTVGLEDSGGAGDGGSGPGVGE
jgi:hypothetical protein